MRHAARPTDDPESGGWLYRASDRAGGGRAAGDSRAAGPARDIPFDEPDTTVISFDEPETTVLGWDEPETTVLDWGEPVTTVFEIGRMASGYATYADTEAVTAVFELGRPVHFEFGAGVVDSVVIDSQVVDYPQYGHPPYESHRYAQAEYPQAEYAQTEYAQTEYPQTEYAQTEYAQTGYAQTEYGQTEYGQTEYAQTGYGQRLWGEEVPGEEALAGAHAAESDFETAESAEPPQEAEPPEEVQAAAPTEAAPGELIPGEEMNEEPLEPAAADWSAEETDEEAPEAEAEPEIDEPGVAEAEIAELEAEAEFDADEAYWGLDDQWPVDTVGGAAEQIISELAPAELVRFPVVARRFFGDDTVRRQIIRWSLNGAPRTDPLAYQLGGDQAEVVTGLVLTTLTCAATGVLGHVGTRHHNGITRWRRNRWVARKRLAAGPVTPLPHFNSVEVAAIGQVIEEAAEDAGFEPDRARRLSILVLAALSRAQH